MHVSLYGCIHEACIYVYVSMYSCTDIYLASHIVPLIKNLTNMLNMKTNLHMDLCMYASGHL